MIKHTTPADLWTGRELTPTRPLVAEDLTRFYLYAPYVREINLGKGKQNPRCTITREGYSAFCLALQSSSSVLPNVRSMGWHMDSLDPLALRYFISPALTSLHITADNFTTGDLASLQYVQQQCPKVIELDVKISGTALDAKRIAQVSDVICSWDLKELNTSHISWRALGRLASSKTLQSLQLNLLTTKNEFNGVSIPSNAFSSLVSLCIDGVPISFGTCISMFRQSTFYHLRTLTIISLTPNPALWEKLTPALRAAHKAPHRLRSLTLKETRDQAATANATNYEANAASAIDALYCFENLDKLNISSSKEFALTPATVESMAKHWPKMRDLEFSVRYRYTPALPLRALESLARGMRDLHTLRLDMNATGVSLEQAPASPFERQTALMTLHVDWSSISSARVVAAYISTLFANIKLVTTKLENGAIRSQGDVRNRRWKKVEYLLPAFTAMREHLEDQKGELDTNGAASHPDTRRKQLNDTDFPSDTE
ncbi:hypothetical protein EV122DRAFT_254485 [Schizophyllum commune]